MCLVPSYSVPIFVRLQPWKPPVLEKIRRQIYQLGRKLRWIQKARNVVPIIGTRQFSAIGNFLKYKQFSGDRQFDDWRNDRRCKAVCADPIENIELFDWWRNRKISCSFCWTTTENFCSLYLTFVPTTHIDEISTVDGAFVAFNRYISLGWAFKRIHFFRLGRSVPMCYLHAGTSQYCHLTFGSVV